MKIEEKLKARYLYSLNLNPFKLIYFIFQFLKFKFKPRIINANWGLDVVIKDKSKADIGNTACSNILSYKVYP